MAAVASVHTSRAIVVGSGIAGLTAALHLGDCTVVTKTDLGAGASGWAQGGIAAALAEDDHATLHAADTLAVSGGLGDATIADLVASSAPSRVRWLEAIGTDFDADETGELTLGREAGHQRRRIVHAGGDATGAEVMRALTAAVRQRPDIALFEHTVVIDLIRSEGHVVGALALVPTGELMAMLAPAVILATGGIGRVYASTTNPPVVTGDGMAMALRAGAAIRSPEFVQFHPTALDSTIDPRPLLTEALRGEGATLVDADGHRYMVDEHPDAELAPRDIVARANWRERQRGPVYLDARLIGESFAERFPTVAAYADEAGIDPVRELLPVAPAQHYHMGGIATDADGRATTPGLFACGEAAATGLHGANRLASNSLLEGLVFGTRAAEAVLAEPAHLPSAGGLLVPEGAVGLTTEEDDEAVAELRDVMWRDAGLVRDEAGLRRALTAVAELRPRLESTLIGRNLLDVAEIVVRAALERRESRGGHYRSDYPEPDPGPPVRTTVTASPRPSVALALPAGSLESVGVSR